MNTHRKRRAQQGAVLVEGLMVGASFVAILACLFVIHRYCSAQLIGLDQARQEAWRRSWAGCGSNDPPLTDLAADIKSGNGPSVPFSLIPTSVNETRSFQVTGGPFSPSGTREIKFLCNPLPVKTKPLTDMVGWLGDMFT